MEPFPISRYLVPATAPAQPSDATLVGEPMAAGMPHAITIAKDTQLVIVFPTGLGTFWRDADPTTRVTSADEETGPLQPGASQEPLSQPQLMIQLRQAGHILASRPLRAGGHLLLPDNGGGATGPQYEVWITDFALFAGTMRGGGDYGSRIALAWRRADAAVSDFGTPPVNVHLLPRLVPKLRLESWPKVRFVVDRPLTIFDSVKLRRMSIDAIADAVKL